MYPHRPQHQQRTGSNGFHYDATLDDEVKVLDQEGEVEKDPTEAMCRAVESILKRHGWPSAIVRNAELQNGKNDSSRSTSFVDTLTHLDPTDRRARSKTWRLLQGCARWIYRAVKAYTGMQLGSMLRWLAFLLALFWTMPVLALWLGFVLCLVAVVTSLYHHYRYKHLRKDGEIARVVFYIDNEGSTDPRKTPHVPQALGPGFEYTIETSVSRVAPSYVNTSDDDDDVDDNDDETTNRRHQKTHRLIREFAVAWTGTRIDTLHLSSDRQSLMTRLWYGTHRLLGLHSYWTPLCLFGVLVCAVHLTNHWEGYPRPFDGVYRVWRALLHDLHRLLI